MAPGFATGGLARRRIVAVILASAAMAITGIGAPGCPGRKTEKVACVTSFEAGDEADPGDEAGDAPAGTQDALDAVEAVEAADAAGEPDAEVVAAAEAGDLPPGVAWRVTIGAAGDVIPHGRVKATADNQAVSPDVPGDEANQGWWFIVKNLAPALEATDVDVFNLESPLATERFEAKTQPPIQNGPPILAEAFRAAGFDVASLANNHMFDQLRPGVTETVDAVTKAGLLPVGAGSSQDEAKKPLVIVRAGVRIAFLAWTMALNRNLLDDQKDEPWVMKWSDDWARKAVSAARSEADLVVVVMHWGSEFGLPVNAHEKDAAKVLCAAGADLIIGSGPHVLQPVSFVKDAASGRRCLVAYSLGNVLSNQGLKYRFGWKPPDLLQAKNVPYTRDGLFLRVTMIGRVDGEVEVEEIEGVPLWTENNWILRYEEKPPPPDRIWIQPILPLLETLADPEDLHRKLLEERLGIIREMVGDLVTYVRI